MSKPSPSSTRRIASRIVGWSSTIRMRALTTRGSCSANDPRPERLEVVGPLAGADEPHRNAQLLADRQHDAALRGPVQLRQHDPRHVHRLREGSGLGDPILTRRRVEDEQGLGDRRRPPSRRPAPIFRSSSISGALRVESSGRIHDEDVGPPRDGGRDGVEHHRARVGAALLATTRWAPARTAQTSSCSPAAARNVSAPARLTVCPSPTNRRASFPIVVVFPEPFTPTTRITPRPSSGSDEPRIRPEDLRSSLRGGATSASASRDHRARTRSTSSDAAVGPDVRLQQDVVERAARRPSPPSLDSRVGPGFRAARGARARRLDRRCRGFRPRLFVAGAAAASLRAAERRKKMNPRATTTNRTATAISTPGR